MSLPIADAKSYLEKIDEILSGKHLLIGGLAVQQYHPTRNSKDIDLVCEFSEIAHVIDEIFPTRDYEVIDKNQDELRPSYILTDRTGNGDSVAFIGPKIQERENYEYIDWELMMEGAVPFKYQGRTFKNIVIPEIEHLCFSKLVSFINRADKAAEKGLQDLKDFVNLTNNKDFRINKFYDIIRRWEAEQHISEGIARLNKDVDLAHMEGSTIFEVFKIHFPGAETEFGKVFSRVYALNETEEFYEAVARRYDARNSDLRYRAHQGVIKIVRDEISDNRACKVVDIGCGTGKIIGSHFVHEKGVEWIGIDLSEKMLEQFQKNMSGHEAETKAIKLDVQSDELTPYIEDSDVVLICFTLTSLYDDTIVERTLEDMKPGAILVISDIHPSYTIRKPHYSFEVGGLGLISLRPRPVFPDLLEQAAARSGGDRLQSNVVESESSDPYSFFMKIVKN